MPVSINLISSSGVGLYTNVSDSTSYFLSASVRHFEVSDNVTISTLNTTNLSSSNGAFISGVTKINTASFSRGVNSGSIVAYNNNVDFDASTNRVFQFLKNTTTGDQNFTASINNFPSGGDVYLFVKPNTTINNIARMHIRCASGTSNYSNPKIAGANNGNLFQYNIGSEHTICFIFNTTETIGVHIFNIGNNVYFGYAVSNNIT